MNELEKRIGSGKAIKGLKGFVQVNVGVDNSKAYIPILVVGLHPTSDGIRINAQLTGSGFGHFVLSPKEFIASMDEVKQVVLVMQRKDQAERDRKHINAGHRGYGSTARVGLSKSRLAEYVRGMSPKIHKRFVEAALDDEIIKLRDGKNIMDTWQQQVNSSTLRQLTDLAVTVKNDLPDIDDDDWDD